MHKILYWRHVFTQGGFYKHEALHFFTNWVVNEAAYLEELKADPNKEIFEF